MIILSNIVSLLDLQDFSDGEGNVMDLLMYSDI